MFLTLINVIFIFLGHECDRSDSWSRMHKGGQTDPCSFPMEFGLTVFWIHFKSIIIFIFLKFYGLKKNKKVPGQPSSSAKIMSFTFNGHYIHGKLERSCKWQGNDNTHSIAHMAADVVYSDCIHFTHVHA